MATKLIYKYEEKGQELEMKYYRELDIRWPIEVENQTSVFQTRDYSLNYRLSLCKLCHRFVHFINDRVEISLKHQSKKAWNHGQDISVAYASRHEVLRSGGLLDV